MKVLVFVLLVCVSSALSAQSNDEAREKVDEPLKFKYNFVPMPSFDPSTKFGISVVNLFTYRLDVKDTISPASVGSIGLQYTSNDSRMVGVTNAMYLSEDKWRLTAQFIYGNLHQELDLGFDHVTDVNRYVWLLNLQALRHIYMRFYFGLGYSFKKIEYDGRNDEADNDLEQQGLLGGEGSHGIKYFLTHDVRDNVYYPYKGHYGAYRLEQFMESGSSGAYLAHNFDYRQFVSFGQRKGKHVLGARLLSRVLTGSPTPQNYSYYGRTGGDIERGYETGKHIDENMVNIEAEYRLETPLLNHKLGFVGFAGVGKVFGDFYDFSDADWLPVGGVGARYRLVPEVRMNLRIDAAVGNEGLMIYFGIREAF